MKAALFGVFVLVFVASTYAQSQSGSLSVYNSGGYVAKFTVNYLLNGQRKTEDSGNFSLGVTKSILLPAGAKDINMKTEIYWFPGQLSTVFNKHYDGPVQECFKIWGTTLNPKWDSITC